MRLLFIAPNVPLHDRNSGDYRLFSLLKILSKTCTITYLAQRRACPESSEDDRYASHLSDLGIDVHVQDYSIINILRTQKFQAAILEFYFLAEHYLPRIRLLQPSCPVIIDTVDVHHVRLLSKYQTTNNEQDLREFEETRRSELDIYRKADKVIAITEEDAHKLLRVCPQLDVAIVPNIHSPIALNGIQDKNRLIFVGGFGHDANTDAVLYFCKHILPLIRSKMPDVRLTIAGSDPPKQIRDLSREHITVTGYVPSTTPYLQGSYISVAPLRYGAGMKGKIGEAMAHGLPVVTTSVGAEGMGLRHRENAMIADYPEKFADAVIELMQDEDLYATVSRNAVCHISNNYTAEIVGKTFRNILRGIIEGPVKKISLSEKTTIVLSHTLHRIKNKFVHIQHS
jgi:glycosyltransferase involved in cell wall biosynthesis